MIAWGSAGALALALIGFGLYRFLGASEEGTEAIQPQLDTATVERRDLAETEEVSGTVEYGDPVTVSALASGVLTSLAGEGDLLERGELAYIVSDQPSDLDLASADQRVASAAAQLAGARGQRSSLLEGASESELASAEAAVIQAQAALDELIAPASEADLLNARAQLAKAEAAYSDLFDGPTSQQMAEAKAQLDRAAQALSAAQISLDTAWINLLSAQATYCALTTPPVAGLCTQSDLPLTAGDIDSLTASVPTLLAAGDAAAVGAVQGFINANGAYTGAQSSHELAVADLSSAQQAYDTLDDPPEQSDIDLALAAVRQAEELLADLQAGPTEVQIQLAEANLRAAESRLTDLEAGASQTDRQQANASVESARLAVEIAELERSELEAGAQGAVVMYGDLPAWRDLSVDSAPGDDIEQLERNLAALGFDPGTIDKTFDDATRQAVMGWQEELGAEATGEVSAGSVVFIPGPSLVDAASASVGGAVTVGSPLLELVPVSRVVQSESGEGLELAQRVTIDLSVDDLDLLQLGTKVVIELPGGTELEGNVTDIGSVTTTTNQQGGTSSTVDVTVVPSETIDPELRGTDVTVHITTQLAEAVLTVPVSALLALTEGGYAVEVVEPDDTTRLVGVETGMFADGWVEVSGEGLTEGMRVVVPG
jgi:multidrug efflux pump subunit AcrA (membrane-fusion protein)